MEKFEADARTIEVCDVAMAKPGYANRQLITLLSFRGVRDGAFLEMQEDMVAQARLTAPRPADALHTHCCSPKAL